jgi:hypothetical protein
MAAGDIYRNQGTKVYFSPASATNNDVTFEVDGLGAGAGRQSAQWNRGSGAQPAEYEVRAFAKFAAQPVLDEIIGVFLKTSDSTGGTQSDNDDGVSDAAVSSEDKLKNLPQILTLTVDEENVSVELGKSALVVIVAQYVQVVWWNYTVDQISTGVNDSGVWFKPTHRQIQS